uniref:Uncharacterized protein n=1 Tax=Peronospora matthiolae TaxID=2874970 RepID=A0AAV1TYW3_9STRA
MIKSDEVDDDAGVFSIANDCCTENDAILADKKEEERTLSAVITRRTGQSNAEQKKDFCWLVKQWSVSSGFHRLRGGPAETER